MKRYEACDRFYIITRKALEAADARHQLMQLRWIEHQTREEVYTNVFNHVMTEVKDSLAGREI